MLADGVNLSRFVGVSFDDEAAEKDMVLYNFFLLLARVRSLFLHGFCVFFVSALRSVFVIAVLYDAKPFKYG